MGRLGVIGHRGFIGSHLIDRLQKTNINYFTFSGNLLNPKEIRLFFRQSNVDTCVFLVGGHFPPNCNLITKNVLTLSNFLEIGVESSLKKIVYASSGAVYGNTLSHPSVENDPLNPNNMYGLTKKMAEELISYHQKHSGLESIILRFTSIYGEGNQVGVISQFLKNIRDKHVVMLEGDGSQYRDFTHISDAVEAIRLAIGYSGSDIFNISTPTHTTINNLIRLFKQKYSFKVIKKPLTNTLLSMSMDTSKASQVLKFEPTVKEILIP